MHLEMGPPALPVQKKLAAAVCGEATARGSAGPHSCAKAPYRALARPEASAQDPGIEAVCVSQP